MARCLVRWTAPLLVVASLIGCGERASGSREASSEHPLALTEIDSVLRTSRVHALIVLDPETCLACDPRVHRVALMADQLRETLPLYFSRSPTDLERKRLVLEGIGANWPVLILDERDSGLTPRLFVLASDSTPQLVEWSASVPIIKRALALALETDLQGSTQTGVQR